MKLRANRKLIKKFTEARPEILAPNHFRGRSKPNGFPRGWWRQLQCRL